MEEDGLLGMLSSNCAISCSSEPEFLANAAAICILKQANGTWLDEVSFRSPCRFDLNSLLMLAASQEH